MKPLLDVVNLTPSSTAFASVSEVTLGVVDALHALHGQLGGGGAAAVVKLHTTLAASGLPAMSLMRGSVVPPRKVAVKVVDPASAAPGFSVRFAETAAEFAL